MSVHRGLVVKWNMSHGKIPYLLEINYLSLGYHTPPGYPTPYHWHLLVIARDLFKLVHLRTYLTSQILISNSGHQRRWYTSYWNDVLFLFWFENRLPSVKFYCTIHIEQIKHLNLGMGSPATCTLECKLQIHQHLLNQSWLNIKICLLN